MKISDNFIVTGIPRAGTSLTAALIDNLDGVLCLSEPGFHNELLQSKKTPTDYVRNVNKHLSDIRILVENSEPVLDIRDQAGNPVTNYYDDHGNRAVSLNPVKDIFGNYKDSSNSLLVGSKHNTHYTSTLEQFVSEGLSVIVVLRHPVPTILSWQRLDLPVSKGELPAARSFWPEIEKISSMSIDTVSKQVMIYNEFCRKYLENLSGIHLVKYEDISINHRIFESMFQRRALRSIDQKNNNRSSLYASNNIETIARKIEMHAPYAAQFYPDIDSF